jgi:hypothetical protein
MRAAAMKPRVRAIYTPIGGRSGHTTALIAAANPYPSRIRMHATRRRGDFVPTPEIPPAGKVQAKSSLIAECSLVRSHFYGIWTH